MPVNPDGLTDVEVQASLSQFITMLDQAMIDQVNPQNVQSEKPPVRNMVDRLRNFTRINPSIFTSTMTREDLQEFVDNVHVMLMSMGGKDIEKAKLLSDNLKDVAQTCCKMRQDSRALGGVPVT